MTQHADKTGRLCVVATPIGNLEDITLRALRVLREATLIAAEDTRRTATLLSHYNISKPLVACPHFSESRVTTRISQEIARGATVALVTDAGFPGISDPGERVIRHCLQENFSIEIIPGPSAVLHALVASGLPTTPFCFEGFIPVKTAQRRLLLAQLIERQHTTVLFESPHRIVKTLNELSLLIPTRKMCLARELTKKFEQVLRGTIAEIAATCSSTPPKGEITLVIAGTDYRA